MQRGETDSHLTIESGKIDGGRRLRWARNLKVEFYFGMCVFSSSKCTRL